jgi:hypothetical protein
MKFLICCITRCNAIDFHSGMEFSIQKLKKIGINAIMDLDDFAIKHVVDDKMSKYIISIS